MCSNLKQEIERMNFRSRTVSITPNGLGVLDCLAPKLFSLELCIQQQMATADQ